MLYKTPLPAMLTGLLNKSKSILRINPTSGRQKMRKKNARLVGNVDSKKKYRSLQACTF
jgi:hypothetical protein